MQDNFNAHQLGNNGREQKSPGRITMQNLNPILFEKAVYSYAVRHNIHQEQHHFFKNTGSEQLFLENI